jgi:lipoprotein-anchoring transpeptidase ErfK/SrfK
MPRPSIVQLTVVLLVALLGTMAIAAAQRVRTHRAEPNAAAAPATAAADQAAARAAAAPPLEATITVPDATPKPAKPAPKPEPTFSVARVKPGRTVTLRSKPHGRVLASVGATTEFGSSTTLAVAARRGPWVGLTSTELPNGTLGWTRSTDPALKAHATHVSLRIDLSRRQLELRDGRKVLRRASVGIGRPGSPTPTGRFSITDKLPGATYSSSVYGCCILALSGHQTNTPAGWQGGNRLAIHGTGNPASIGVPSSAGCLHADAEDLKVLMRKVPLGTPVFIRA